MKQAEETERRRRSGRR